MPDDPTDPVDPPRGLAALLDTLIPASPDGRLPGAGEVGLASYLCEHAADLLPLIRQGLAALDAAAADRDAASFEALGAVDRAETLAAHAENDPVLLPALLFHTYCGYYQQRAVIEGLGLEHRPPFPEGYPLPATDPSLLEGVRQGPRRYRDV